MEPSNHHVQSPSSLRAGSRSEPQRQGSAGVTWPAFLQSPRAAAKTEGEDEFETQLEAMSTADVRRLNVPSSSDDPEAEEPSTTGRAAGNTRSAGFNFLESAAQRLSVISAEPQASFAAGRSLISDDGADDAHVLEVHSVRPSQTDLPEAAMDAPLKASSLLVVRDLGAQFLLLLV